MTDNLSVDGVDWGVDWSVNWGVDGSVDGSVVWGRLVGGAGVGHTAILDVSDISAVAIGISLVVDNLGLAVREHPWPFSTNHIVDPLMLVITIE